MMTAEHPVKLSGPTQLSAKYPSLRHDLLKRCNESLQQQHYKARGSHLYVACWSNCNRDQGFWSAKSVLDHLIVPFWGSWLLDFQRVKDQIAATHNFLICWFYKTGLWSLDSILIPVTNASTQDIQVSTPCRVQIQMNCSANRPDSRTGFTEEVMHPVWVGPCIYFQL